MPSKMPSQHSWLYREYAGNVLELLMTQIMYYLTKMLPFHPGLTCFASKGIICAPSFESCRQAADRKEEYIEDETHKDNCACHGAFAFDIISLLKRNARQRYDCDRDPAAYRGLTRQKFSHYGE